MFRKILIFLIFIQLEKVLCEKEINDYYHIYVHNDSYRGEKFPEKFMTVDGVVPTQKDFTHYLETLSRVVNYFALQLNDTDPNVAIGSYLMKSILKRVLLDYDNKINMKDKATIKHIIFQGDEILSYFAYDCRKYGRGDLGYDLSHLFQYDDSLVTSIKKFNRNTLKKWLTSNLELHEFNEQFDTATLPKEKYVELIIDMDVYYPVVDSDLCLSRIPNLHMPIRKDAEMEACARDIYCEKKVLKMPSIAYALSHRMLYIALVALSRRCYIVSEAVDLTHVDIMCAAMYREAVYLARRGYFYRDIFMEHIALCAFYGYEEFYRDTWFKKTARWIDEDGCMEEFHNFEINRTRVYISRAKTSREVKTMKRLRNMHISEECAHHQMALAMNVLAFGMRHAAAYMKSVA